MTKPRLIAAAVLLALLATSPAWGEDSPSPGPTTLSTQWAPTVFSLPAEEAGDEDGWAFEIHPEYRARFLRIEPLELSGVVAQEVTWAEQRFRLNGTIAKAGVAAVHFQVDALDGALFGDNGAFGREPEVTSGLALASKRGNLSRWKVGLLPDADPLRIDSYGPVLRPMDPLEINYAYGEVLLPIGVLRVGRMPIAEAGDLASNDGRLGRNLWGVSQYHQSADRILFGTKLSEIWRAVQLGDDYVPDNNLKRGVTLGLVYDLMVQDGIVSTDDDLNGFAAQLSWKVETADWLGLPVRNLELTGTYRRLWDQRFATAVNAFPMKARVEVGDFGFRGDLVLISGTSQELAAGFAEFSNEEVRDQKITGLGARGRLWWSPGPVHLLAEVAMASGDDDPRSQTAQTSFSWARDTNLGLLLFEHVLAFQSARAAAVGIENLRQLEAASFPLTEIATEGRVTNVRAIFPQIFWDVVPGLRLKAGALIAFADTPVVDPISTSIAWDGTAIDDDAVNFHGGKPGTTWGTEIDLGVEWLFRDHFQLAVEGGVLLPGDALQDENGDAVRSWMAETRFTFAL